MTEQSTQLIDMKVLERVAPIVRVAAHPLRLRILDYLAIANEPRMVTEITECCGVAPAFISQQLRILKDQGILACRRQGARVYYSIANRSLLHLLACIRNNQTIEPSPNQQGEESSNAGSEQHSSQQDR